MAIAAASFLLGLGVGVALPVSPPGDVMARAEIGPRGGTLDFDGGELRIPTGAVERPVTIEVRAAAVEGRLRVRSGGAEVLVSASDVRAYRFTPATLTFESPATLILDVPDEAANATVFVRSDDGIESLPSDFDPAAGTASVRIGDLGFGI